MTTPNVQSRVTVLVENTGSTATTYTDTVDIGDAEYLFYAYRVRAVNAYGVSEMSKPKEILYTQIPGRPINLEVEMSEADSASGTVTFTLTWDASTSTIGSAPTGYQILRRATHSETDLTILVENTGSTATTYTDTMDIGDSKYLFYAYRVRAVNAYGVSEMSKPKEILYRPQMPGRPSGLSAELDVNGDVVLTWTAPTEGSAPTGYQILRRAPGTEADFVVVADDTGSTATTYTDTTAESNTEYVYRVRARNAAGLGRESQYASVTTVN